MAMTWGDVLADPSLRDLPYKIELNAKGKIEMSPATNRHAYWQMKMAEILMKRPGGTTLGECGVQTSDGVRVPDVMWISESRLGAGLPDPLPVAPEICVEIKSPSNTAVEMFEKARLYIAAGAEEVWVVDLEGTRTVHTR